MLSAPGSLDHVAESLGSTCTQGGVPAEELDNSEGQSSSGQQQQRHTAWVELPTSLNLARRTGFSLAYADNEKGHQAVFCREVNMIDWYEPRQLRREEPVGGALG